MDIIEIGTPHKRHNYGGAIKWIVWPLVVFGLMSLMLYGRVQLKYNDKIVEINEIKDEYQTAMVFGAGLKAKGTPGGVLEDRVLKAIEIYQAGKADILLMSGDNSSANHNEVLAMENLALSKGLSIEAIDHDHAGTSTFESCKRAKEEFKLTKIVLVTQKYHLRRALYVCNELGIDAIGVDSARRKYLKQLQYSLREIPASVVDWLEVRFKK